MQKLNAAEKMKKRNRDVKRKQQQKYGSSMSNIAVGQNKCENYGAAERRHLRASIRYTIRKADLQYGTIFVTKTVISRSKYRRTIRELQVRKLAQTDFSGFGSAGTIDQHFGNRAGSSAKQRKRGRESIYGSGFI